MQDKSASEQQPQDESVSQQQPQDESVSEHQQNESISEQQQGASAAEQPPDKASDTLMSQSSADSISLPDNSTALRTFSTKDPSTVPKKPR